MGPEGVFAVGGEMEGGVHSVSEAAVLGFGGFGGEAAVDDDFGPIVGVGEVFGVGAEMEGGVVGGGAEFYGGEDGLLLTVEDNVDAAALIGGLLGLLALDGGHVGGGVFGLCDVGEVFAVGAEDEGAVEGFVGGLLLAVFDDEGRFAVAGLVGEMLSVGAEIECEGEAHAVGGALVGAGFVFVADDVDAVGALLGDVVDVLAVGAEGDVQNVLVAEAVLAVDGEGEFIVAGALFKPGGAFAVGAEGERRVAVGGETVAFGDVPDLGVEAGAFVGEHAFGGKALVGAFVGGVGDVAVGADLGGVDGFVGGEFFAVGHHVVFLDGGACGDVAGEVFADVRPVVAVGAEVEVVDVVEELFGFDVDDDGGVGGFAGIGDGADVGDVGVVGTELQVGDGDVEGAVFAVDDGELVGVLLIVLGDEGVLFAVGAETELVDELVADHFVTVDDDHFVIAAAGDVHDVLAVGAEDDFLVDGVVDVADFVVLGGGFAVDDDGEAAAAGGDEGDVVAVGADDDALGGLVFGGGGDGVGGDGEGSLLVGAAGEWAPRCRGCGLGGCGVALAGTIAGGTGIGLGVIGVQGEGDKDADQALSHVAHDSASETDVKRAKSIR